MINLRTAIRIVAALGLALVLSSCEPNVYGSVGYSSFGGYGGGSNGRMHGSVSVGGRICC
jgi:hypothetical protein